MGDPGRLTGVRPKRRGTLTGRELNAWSVRRREMANGKPGDHPVNDIVDYRLPVFSERIDELIRQIADYLPRQRLGDLFDWFSPPPGPEFQVQLEAKLAELEADARARGWEPKR